MIKKTLKNYISNLKFIFTPLGVLTMFVLIGLSIVFTNVSNALTTMVNEIQKIISAQQVDFNAAKDVALNRVVALDWKQASESFQTITSQEWLLSVLNESAHAAFPNSEEFAQQVNDIIMTCVGTIMANVMVLLILTVIGVLVGYMVLKYIITKEMVKRSFWRALLKTLLHTLLNLTIIALIVYLVSLLKVSLMINLIISFFLYFIVNFFESYLIYAVKKVPAKKVFNTKNLLFLLLSSFIVAGISVGLCLLFYYTLHIVAAFIFMVTIVQIALVTNELLGESYMQTLLEEENAQKELAAQAASIDDSPAPNKTEDK